MSLVHRYLQASFAMADSSVGGGNSMSFSDLRMSVVVTMASSLFPHLRLSIFGMTLDHMNALSYVPNLAPNAIGNNTILVQAGDQEHGMSTIFEGTIYIAWPNMQNAPEVSFDVEAISGAYNGAKPPNPPWLSYTGPTDAAQVWQKLAKLNDPPLAFENNGLNLKIDSPYLFGSTRNMMEQFAKYTRNGWVVDRGTLAVWPQGGSRAASSELIASPGMVSYPAAAPGYIVVKKLFDRAETPGAQVTIKSDITKANGSWRIGYINYQLSNFQMPHNPWFTTLFCNKLGTAAPPPTAG